MKNTRYSIEFAHIYTDEEFGVNHVRSIEQLQDFRDLQGIDFTSIVLIDNYNASVKGFNTRKFLKELKQRGANPDFYAYERDLIIAADRLIEAIQKPKVKRLYKNYIARKKKYPCSLLTAAWYLVRLGAIEEEGIVRINNKKEFNKYTPATRIVNILPKEFTDVEKEAYKIISHTSYSEYRYLIQPILLTDTIPQRKRPNSLTPILVTAT